MATPDTNIARLLPLFEMAYEVEQMKVAKITAKMDRLRRQLSALDRPKDTTAGTLTAAVVAGADLRWEKWAQDRKALINRELAKAARDREQAKTGLIKALSKREAAKQMQSVAMRDLERLTQRRRDF